MPLVEFDAPPRSGAPGVGAPLPPPPRPPPRLPAPPVRTSVGPPERPKVSLTLVPDGPSPVRGRPAEGTTADTAAAPLPIAFADGRVSGLTDGRACSVTV